MDTSFAGSPFAAPQSFSVLSVLQNPVVLPGGSFQFQLLARPAGLKYQVYASMNVGPPASNWVLLGIADQVGNSDLFQFIDTTNSSLTRRYFRVRQPGL